MSAEYEGPLYRHGQSLQLDATHDPVAGQPFCKHGTPHVTTTMPRGSTALLHTCATKRSVFPAVDRYGKRPFRAVFAGRSHNSSSIRSMFLSCSSNLWKLQPPMDMAGDPSALPNTRSIEAPDSSLSSGRFTSPASAR